MTGSDLPTAYSHADRIEFTAASHSGRLCYGLVVLVPLLSTPHCCDAVTVRYHTIHHRTEADFHRPFPSPSQAHYYPAAQSQPTAVVGYSSEVRIANLPARGIFPTPYVNLGSNQ